jgi:hypothetical protein
MPRDSHWVVVDRRLQIQKYDRDTLEDSLIRMTVDR